MLYVVTFGPLCTRSQHLSVNVTVYWPQAVCLNSCFNSFSSRLTVIWACSSAQYWILPDLWYDNLLL